MVADHVLIPRVRQAAIAAHVIVVCIYCVLSARHHCVLLRRLFVLRTTVVLLQLIESQPKVRQNPVLGGNFCSVNNESFRTMDFFEETIGVNHLENFLLADLIAPILAMWNSAPRILSTALPVHDPNSCGGNVGRTALLGNI